MFLGRNGFTTQKMPKAVASILSPMKRTTLGPGPQVGTEGSFFSIPAARKPSLAPMVKPITKPFSVPVASAVPERRATIQPVRVIYAPGREATQLLNVAREKCRRRSGTWRWSADRTSGQCIVGTKIVHRAGHREPKAEPLVTLLPTAVPKGPVIRPLPAPLRTDPELERLRREEADLIKELEAAKRARSVRPVEAQQVAVEEEVDFEAASQPFFPTMPPVALAPTQFAEEEEAEAPVVTESEGVAIPKKDYTPLLLIFGAVVAGVLLLKKK